MSRAPKSPPSLRRYRAERLLRSEFDGLRTNVLTTVSKRLAGTGTRLAYADLEACYAQAWQGLYSAILDGEQVDNPAGWLALVTFRRALDEHRSRATLRGELCADLDARELAVQERDIAGELDDRLRLRQVLEALRSRLSERECQAASLCYLQGLSRSEAASCMGISPARMRKLMEGRGPGKPGVSGKVFELLGTIQSGGWCEEQASLMRALAFGVLDPQGDRYRLAIAHRRECPGCRRYVLSLRGLAAVLPPVALPWPLADGGLQSGSARPARRLVAKLARPSGARASVAPGKLVAGLLAFGVATSGVGLLSWSARSEAHRSGALSGSDRRPSGVHGDGSQPGGGLSISHAQRARAHARAIDVLRADAHAHTQTPGATREFGPERGSARLAATTAGRSVRSPSGQSIPSRERPPTGTGGPAGLQAKREFGIE